MLGKCPATEPQPCGLVSLIFLGGRSMRVLETVSQSCPGSLCPAQLDTVILLPHAPKLLGHQALLSLVQKSSGQCEDSIYKCLSLGVCIVISHRRCIWKLCPYYTVSRLSLATFHSHVIFIVTTSIILCILFIKGTFSVSTIVSTGAYIRHYTGFPFQCLEDSW